jgi:hypothetical protein
MTTQKPELVKDHTEATRIAPEELAELRALKDAETDAGVKQRLAVTEYEFAAARVADFGHRMKRKYGLEGGSISKDGTLKRTPVADPSAPPSPGSSGE